jgi:hypothetical protein
MRQNSKRYRELYGSPQKGTTFEYRKALRDMAAKEPLVVEDERIWINRGVQGISHTELKTTARLFKPHEMKAKFARYSLSVVIPGEIYIAINNSELPSVNPGILAERLFQGFPASAQRPVVAEVDGLHQFGAWVGLNADYDSFGAERKFVSEYLSDALGIDHDWKANAHISLAKGALSRISNLEEIEASLPRFVQLSEVTE